MLYNICTNVDYGGDDIGDAFFDERRHWIKSRVGIELQQAPRELAFFPDVDSDEGVVEITDPLHDTRFSQSPLVTGDSQIRFFARASIKSPSGPTLGMLCVMDRRPRRLGERQRGCSLSVG